MLGGPFQILQIRSKAAIARLGANNSLLVNIVASVGQLSAIISMVIRSTIEVRTSWAYAVVATWNWINDSKN